MNKEAIESLLARVKAATEGSNELDFAISHLIRPGAIQRPYTQSIDAIVGLIEAQLPGWRGDVRLGNFPPHEARDRAVLWSGDTTRRESLFGCGGDGSTPALALCAAFLSALLEYSR